MSRENFRTEMKDGEKSVQFDGPNFKKVMERSLDGAEVKTCNEKYDIRETSVRGNPFTPSAQGVLRRELQASEKPSVGSNPDLHTDTTDPGDNKVTSQVGTEKKMAPSAEWLVGQQKDKKVPDAVKRTVFNS